MKYATLNQRNESVDLDELGDYGALYSGAKAVGARLDRLMPQRPEEHADVYKFRKSAFHYVNYAGPIINYYVAALFTARLEVRATSGAAPEWYAAFKNDVDQAGTDLVPFLRERLAMALVKRTSWVLVDFPDAGAKPAESALEWEERGLGDGYLCAIDPECVLDWECDAKGELKWAIVHSRETTREDPTQDRDTIVETWTIYRRETWERFQLTYKADKPPTADDDVLCIGGGPIATKGRVPLVRIEMPAGLWAMELLASPQVANFRARNALAWSLDRTCFSSRIFYLREDFSTRPVTGPGYGLYLGIDERVEHDAPPSSAFEPVAKYVADTKDEIYRIANQLAQGVNNNAAAMGRSGESKDADNEALKALLCAFGEVVREAVSKIYKLLSMGRKEAVEWSISGLDCFNTEDLQALVETALGEAGLDIPSPTFRRVRATHVAHALTRHASQDERDKMAAEIKANLTDEVVLKPKPDPLAQPPIDDDEDDEGGGLCEDCKPSEVEPTAN